MDDLKWLEIKWIKFLLTFMAAALAVYVLKELKTIFLPLIFALFLSFVFSPLDNFLTKHRIPKFLVIILMMVIIFALITLTGFVVYAAINSFVIEFPKYQARMIDTINRSYASIQNLILRLEGFYSRVPEWFDSSQILPPGTFSLPRFLGGTMGNFFDFVIKVFLTLLYLAFIVAGSEKMEIRVRKALKESRNERTFYVIDGIRRQIKDYLINKTFISLVTSIASMLAVLLFRIDFVVMTGLLIFVLNFIPNFGSIVASIFPILICLLQYGFGWRVIGISFSMFVIQMTFGNIIEPNLQGKGLNLSPIVVLVCLVFWGWVWGTVGMIIAVPLTSALNIVLKGFDESSIISAVISDN